MSGRRACRRWMRVTFRFLSVNWGWSLAVSLRVRVDDRGVRLVERGGLWGGALFWMGGTARDRPPPYVGICAGLSSKRPWPLGLRTFLVSFGRSRGTGPRATSPKKPSSHRRARACPSPCIDRDSKRPCLWGCGRFSFRQRDRGGQAPALRYKRRFSFRRRARGGQAPALR